MEGPDYGVGYEHPDDIVIWSGLAALAAPEVIDGTLAMVEQYDLWEGFLIGDLPGSVKTMLKNGMGSDWPHQLAAEAELVSRGIALESMSTYTWRTPHYQLSGAQDYNPGYWGTQTHMWQATLDGEAYVFTTLPSTIEGLGLSVSAAGEWIGSWLPRVTLHRNVGVIQYRAGELEGLVSNFIKPGKAHAYFHKDRFDELRQEGNNTVGRKGDAYLALLSEEPVAWSAEGEHAAYDLRTEASENTWVVELGSAEEHGSFSAFADAVLGAEISFGDGVSYDSPSVGLVEVGWESPFVVAGEEVDLGPYPRWQNDFCQTEHGALRTRIEHEGRILELDFEEGRRRLLAR